LENIASSSPIHLVPQFPGTFERHHPAGGQNGILTRRWISTFLIGVQMDGGTFSKLAKISFSVKGLVIVDIFLEGR
jgi:hypothetical protein